MHRFFDHITKPLLDLLPVRSILQMGAGTGELGELLAAYCEARHAKLTIIEPFRQFDADAMTKRYTSHVNLPRGSSLELLPTLLAFDVVFIDGDPNYSTVHRELCLIQDHARKHGVSFPVTLIHNTGWPYAFRDRYRDPGSIPETERHTYTEGGLTLSSAIPLEDCGISARSFHAIREGGPKNGVATAVEDFLGKSANTLLRYSIAGFHGLTILIPRELDHLYDFISTLPIGGMNMAHAGALEHARIEADLALAESKKETRIEQQKHEQSMKMQMKEKFMKLEEDVKRMQRTLSWRMTLPLRLAGKAFQCMRKVSWWFDVVKQALMKTGTFVSWLRHDVIGRFVSATPSEEKSAANQTMAQPSVRQQSTVSAIVAARNNGRFLRECLSSICAQSVQPLEIIYCDDGSTDDSIAIASSFPDIKILARKHGGVAEARNAGVAASRGDLLLHVDGDDMLTPDFLAEHLHAIGTDAGAVMAYGPTEKFGCEHMLRPTQPWNLRQLWTENFINSSSLIRRYAFDAAGGWRDSCGTLWDWDLWLRMARIGTGVESKGLLLYRRHESSWAMQVRRELPEGNINPVLGRIRRSVAKISVCAIIGGRLPSLLPQWIDSIAESIRAYDGTAEKPELVILDNSEGGCAKNILEQALKRHSDIFRSVLILPYPQKFAWRTEMERRHQLSIFLKHAYNRLQAIADGEILWYIEDDVIVPTHAFGRLLTLLTDGSPPPAAVSGLYRNRHREAFLGHTLLPDGSPQSIVPLGNEVLELDLGGTGCLMVLRPVAPYAFDSHWRGRAPAHDWTWCQKARDAGQKILLDASVRCRHYRTPEEWV